MTSQEEPARPPSAPEVSPGERLHHTVTSALMVSIVLIVGIGVGATEPGLLIPYVLVSLPALIAACAKSSQSLSRSRSMGLAEKFVAFMSSAGIIVAVMGGIVLAVVVAAVLFCSAVIGLQGKTLNSL